MEESLDKLKQALVYNVGTSVHSTTKGHYDWLEEQSGIPSFGLFGLTCELAGIYAAKTVSDVFTKNIEEPFKNMEEQLAKEKEEEEKKKKEAMMKKIECSAEVMVESPWKN